MPTCTHTGTIRKVTPSGKGCKECLEMGDTWVHLRLCLECGHVELAVATGRQVECGHVGCCDSSKNKHARAHFNKTKHPIIQSFEPGENWRWCYIDDDYID